MRLGTAMSEGVYDMVCKQGETFSRLLTVTDNGGNPVDLTGYHALMHVRKTHAASQPLLTLSDEGADPRIVFDPLQGKFSMVVSPADTQALPAINAVYDLKLTSPAGYVTRLLEGKFVVTAGVTRAA